MEELEYIKSERLRLQEKYLKEAREVWMQFEGEEAAPFVNGVLDKLKSKLK